MHGMRKIVNSRAGERVQQGSEAAESRAESERPAINTDGEDARPPDRGREIRRHAGSRLQTDKALLRDGLGRDRAEQESHHGRRRREGGGRDLRVGVRRCRPRQEHGLRID